MALPKLGSVLVCCVFPARLWLNQLASVLSVKWGLTFFATEVFWEVHRYIGMLWCFGSGVLINVCLLLLMRFTETGYGR